jgi:hypothetical protein
VHTDTLESTKGPNFFRIGHPQWATKSLWTDLRNCSEIERCFRRSRCAGHVLTVYVYPPVVTNAQTKCGSLSDRNALDAAGVIRDLAASGAATLTPIRVVSTPTAACLLIVTRDSFVGPDEMQSAPTWDGGRNHMLWQYQHFPSCTDGAGWAKKDLMHGDRSFAADIDTGFAALASSSHTPASFRPGFDMSLPLRPHYDWSPAQRALAADRPRSLLLAFKGSIYKQFPTWWNQHRMVGANYLHDPQNGIVISGCPGSAKEKYDFATLLLNTEFAFAPGGGGSNSFRFAEAMIAGAIPVVMTDQAPLPFAPEADWSRCAVKVHGTRIVQLGTVLPMLRPDLPKRRQACAELFNRTIGENDAVSWAKRLQRFAR